MLIAHPADDSSTTDTLRTAMRLLQHKFHTLVRRRAPTDAYSKGLLAK